MICGPPKFKPDKIILLIIYLIKIKLKDSGPGMVVHACNPRTLGAKAGRSLELREFKTSPAT